MPAIGPVYQPTTYNIGYLPQTEWPQQSRRSRLTRLMDLLESKECCRLSFLIFATVAVCFAIFAVFKICLMLHNGGFGIDGGAVWLIMLFLMLVACFLSLFVWYTKRTSSKQFSWPWFVSKEGITRQMSSQPNNEQTILNPSTDLLVTSAQYGPNTEGPPALHEEDERRNLMGSDNKDVNDENEERPLEPDPRIVLRPPGHREDV